MRIDKVKWITAHNYGQQKWHSFTPSLTLYNQAGGGGGGVESTTPRRFAR